MGYYLKGFLYVITYFSFMLIKVYVYVCMHVCTYFSCKSMQTQVRKLDHITLFSLESLHTLKEMYHKWEVKSGWDRLPRVLLESTPFRYVNMRSAISGPLINFKAAILSTFPRKSVSGMYSMFETGLPENNRMFQKPHCITSSIKHRQVQVLKP